MLATSKAHAAPDGAAPARIDQTLNGWILFVGAVCFFFFVGAHLSMPELFEKAALPPHVGETV